MVQWWATKIPPADIGRKVIISLFGPFYIDRGVGNYHGSSYGNYSTWRDIYHELKFEEGT